MDRARREVEESRVRKEADKADRKRKKLADIREEELRNDPVVLDNAAREKSQPTGRHTGHRPTY